jgi:hypothetical protein
MILRKVAGCLALLALAAPTGSFCASKPHAIALGTVRHEPYSAEGDPAAARKDESALPVRPLVVDGKVKEWTTGDAHDVTERSFAVRRAMRINDALPSEHASRWVWQRGPWLLVDRTSGKVTALHLPDFDPAVSEAVWFRDYAAYCGMNTSGKELLAVVAQVQARRPLLARKLVGWDPADHPAPACAPAIWQREPLKVSFQATGGTQVSFDLVGASAVLVEDDDGDQ